VAQVADHFAYLALPGMTALYAGACLHCWEQIHGARRMLVSASAVAVLGVLAVTSWQHQQLVAHPASLWQDNAAKNPGSWIVQNNLGRALANAGKFDDAAAHFLEAVRIKPDLVPAHYNLGRIYLLQGNSMRAAQCLSNAIAITPENFAIELALADALARQGDSDGSRFHTVVAQCRQAKALLKEGNAAGAIAAWQAALNLNSNSVEAIDNLAWTLATIRDDKLRNGAEALVLAQRLYNMGGSNVPPVLDTLAAAYAETGKFMEAGNTVQRAIALATAAGNTNGVKQFRAHLKLYEQSRPVRE
jgi:tetratricopeptide (TPR) repeat protein